MTQVQNYAVPPGTRASVRQGFNAVLAALRDDNAGPTAPPNPVPGMMWLDTSTTPPTPRRRNVANTAWNNETIVVPAGMVGHYAAPSPPAGWLVRDGAAYSRTVYAALFAAIGTTYGPGNGSTTFNVPDDRANFDRGWDNGRGIDVGRGFASEQSATHTLQKMHDWTGDDRSIESNFGVGQSYAHADTESFSNSPPANPRNANGTGWSSGSADNMSIGGHQGVGDPGFAGRWISYRPRNRAYLPIIKF